MTDTRTSDKRQLKIDTIKAITNAYETLKLMSSVYDNLDFEELSSALLHVRSSVRLTSDHE